jgi:hypothetical protein
MSEIININWSLVGTLIVTFLICGILKGIFHLIIAYFEEQEHLIGC